MKNFNFLNQLFGTEGSPNQTGKTLTPSEFAERTQNSSKPRRPREVQSLYSACSAVDVPMTSYGASDEHPMSTRSASDGGRWNSRAWKYVACMLMVLFLGVGQMWGETEISFAPSENNTTKDNVTVNGTTNAKLKIANTSNQTGWKVDGSGTITISSTSFNITKVVFIGNEKSESTGTANGAGFKVSSDGSSYEFLRNGFTLTDQGGSTHYYSDPAIVNKANVATSSTVTMEFASAQRYVQIVKGSGSQTNISSIKVYTEPAYTITWANGGHGTAPTSPVAAASVMLPKLFADGYKHTGWKANQSTKVNGSSTAANTLIANGSSVLLEANTTLTAQWEEVECPDGGTIFSLSLNKVSTKKSLAAYEEVDVSTYATISKGEAVYSNTGSNAKGEVTNADPGKLQFNDNSIFLKVSVYCALQTGDVISFTDGAALAITANNSRVTTNVFNGSSQFTVTSSFLNGAHEFYIWKNSSNSTLKTLTITRPVACTSHSVNLSSSGSVTGGTFTTSSATVCEDGKATLTATPAAGYEFTSWSATGTGGHSLSSTTTNPATLTMGTADVTVNATFSQIDYTVSKTLTNCAVKAGSTSIPSTMHYGDDLSTIIEPTTGNLLPGSVTVSGVTSYTWNALTGALTLTDVTGNVSITVAAAAPQTGTGTTVTYSLVTSGSTAATYSTGVFTGILSDGTANKNTIVASKVLSGGNGVAVQSDKNKPKNSRTAGITCSTADFNAASSPYAEFTFNVVDGYTFTPTAISVPVMPITYDAYFTAIVTDGSSTWTSATTSCTQGNTATINATPAGGSALTGTVHIRVFCHNQETAAKGFRFGTGDVTITGTVAEEASCSAPTAVNITQTEGSADMIAGESFTLSAATSTGVETGATYQWYRGSTEVGTNSPTFTVSSCTSVDAGTYWCKITNPCSTDAHTTNVTGFGIKVWQVLLCESSSWNAYDLTSTGTKTGEVTRQLTPGTYYIKLTHNNGVDFGVNTGETISEITETTPSAWTLYNGQNNIKVTVTTAGDYTFGVNYTSADNPTLSVTYPPSTISSCDKIYFCPTVNSIATGSAKFSIYFYNATQNAWANCYLVDGTEFADDAKYVAYAPAPGGWTGMIVVRDDEYVTSWDRWNQSEDITYNGYNYIIGRNEWTSDNPKKFKTHLNSFYSSTTPAMAESDYCVVVGGTTTASTNLPSSAVTYTSSDEAKATVGSTTGVITGVAAGTATITAKVGTCTVGTATVTVYAAPSVTLSASSATYGGSAPTLTPNNFATITDYSSFTTGTATINGSGVISIVAAGTTTFTVTGTDRCGNDVNVTTGTFTVNKANITPTLSYASVGGTTLTVGATSSGSPTVSGNTGNGGVTYSSGNTSVATVNETTGVVTAVAAGSATITATIAATTNYNGNTATATFTIEAADDDCPSAASGQTIFKFAVATGRGTGNVCAAASTDYSQTVANGILTTLEGGTLTARNNGTLGNFVFDKDAYHFTGGASGFLKIDLDCELATGDVIRYINRGATGGKVAVRKTQGNSSSQIELPGNTSPTLMQTVVVTSSFNGLSTIYIERGANDPYLMSFEIIRPYVVTLDANTNGGKVNGSSNTATVYMKASEPQNLPPAKKSGSRFLGWFEAESGGDAVNYRYTATGSTTLYAQYGDCPASGTLYEWTVRDDISNGSLYAGISGTATLDATTGNYLSELAGGELKIYNSNNHAKINSHSFYIDDNAPYLIVNLDCPITAGDQFKTTISDHSIYVTKTAKRASTQELATGADEKTTVADGFAGQTTLYLWRGDGNAKISHFEIIRPAATVRTVTFDYNGGSGSPASVTQDAIGAAVTLATPSARTGYTFAGWYTAASGGTIVGNAGGSYTPSANITVYAHWTAKTTAITFDANTDNNGSTGGSATATYDGTTLRSVTHATPASGYQLTGYYTAATSGTKIINADGTLVQNTTYTSNETTPKWKSDLSSLTLYARYEACTPINAYVRFDNNNSAKYNTEWNASTDITTSGGASYTLTNCSVDGDKHPNSIMAIKGTKNTRLITLTIPIGATSGNITIKACTYAGKSATLAIKNSSGAVLVSKNVGLNDKNSETYKINSPDGKSWSDPTLQTISYDITAGGTYYIDETGNNKDVYIYAFSATGVRDCGCSAPVIGTHPDNQDKTLGETVEFSVVASGADSYQWYRCSSDGNNLQEISGATSDTYSFTAAITGTTYYRCRAIADCGETVLSNVATCAITPATFTFHHTANVADNATQGTFTTSQEISSNVSAQFSSLSAWTFNGVTASNADADATHSMAVSMPADYDADKYLSYSVTLAENYRLRLTNLDLQAEAVTNSDQAFRIVISDENGHSYTKDIASIGATGEKVQLCGNISDATYFVGTITLKLYGWQSTGTDFYRIAKDVYLTGEVVDLPAPPVSWNLHPSSAKVSDGGQAFSVTTDGTNTVEWAITSPNGADGAVLTQSDASPTSATLGSYTEAGSLYVTATVTGDGIKYNSSTPVTIRQYVTIAPACAAATTLISYTLTADAPNGTGLTASGTPGGTADINIYDKSKDYKMGADGHYFRLTLDEGDYAAGDVLSIAISAVSDVGDTKLHIYKYASSTWTELASVSAASAGTYTYTLTDDDVAGSFNSIGLYRESKNQNPKLLSMSVERPSDCDAGDPPTISVHPADADYSVDDEATALSVTATGATAFQWYSNASASKTGGTVLEGQTSTTYTPSTSLAGTYYYYCVVSNAYGSVTSDVATITVASSKSDPNASWAIADPVYGGGGYSLSVTARNSANNSNWDGTVTAGMLSAPEGVILSNVSASGQTITAEYAVTTDAVSPLVFSLTLPSSTLHNAAVLNSGDVRFDACVGADESGNTETYDFSAADALDDWTIVKSNKAYVVEAAATCSGNSNITSGDASDKIMAMDITATSSGSITVTTNQSFKNISNITFDFISSDTQKPQVTLKVVGASSTTTLINSKEPKKGLGTSGTNTWLRDYSYDLETPLSGKVQFVFSSGSSNKQFALDNIEITYVSEGTITRTETTAIAWESAPEETVEKDEGALGFKYVATKSNSAAIASYSQIVYTSSDPSVATVNSATGEVHIMSGIDFGGDKYKTTTIKATLAPYGCFTGDELSYVLQVNKVACADVAGTITATSSATDVVIDGNRVTKNPCDEITLTVSGHTGEGAGATYQWYKEDTPLDEEEDISLTGVTEAGVYSVIVTNGCSKVSSNSITITNTAVSASAIVDEWYVKNGRRTPDVALVRLAGTRAWKVNDGTNDIWVTNAAGTATTTTGFGGCRFELRDGVVYLKGTQPDGSAPSGLDGGNDKTLTITAIHGCSGSDQTASVTIHMQESTTRKSVAFVVDGTKNGGFDAVTTTKTSERSIWTTLSEKFDLTGQNMYSTIDQKEIMEHYSQFDAIFITDDPNTQEKPEEKAKTSFVKAFGCMVDIRPLLTLEAYVGRWTDGNWQVYDAQPNSPSTRAFELKLQCKDHDIFSGLEGMYNFRSEEEDGEFYYYVTMVDESLSPYAGTSETASALPALQGFDPTKFSNMLAIGTIAGGTLQGGVERQSEPAARMMILGINNNAMSALTEEGKTVLSNALEYLLNTDMESINDCSNFFLGNATNGSKTDWNNSGNWSSGKVPDHSTTARIMAPVVLDGVTVKAAQVDIVVGGSSQKMGGRTPAGKVTIQPTGALIVDGKIRRAKAPNFGVEDLMPTTPADLVIYTDEDNQGALIFDNSNGETQATVNLYSKAHMEEGSRKWQYLASPIQSAPIYDYFYGSGIYTYKHIEAENGWVRYGLGTTLEAFDAIGITQNDQKFYTFDGPLASTVDRDLELTYTSTVSKRGVNMFGNSWSAPIQLTKMEDGDFGEGVKKTVYVYNTGKQLATGNNHSDGSDTPGQWQSIPLSSLSVLEGVGAWTGLTVIPAYQAFQLKRTEGATEPVVHLSYDKHVRPATRDVNAALRAPRRHTAADVLAMRITVYDVHTHSDIYLLESGIFTDGFDNGWDGDYMNNDTRSARLYAVSPELGNMAVTAQPDLDGTFLGFRKGKSDEYTFTFHCADGEYYLNDIKKQESTLIRTGNTYSFVWENGDDVNRFYISATPFDKPGIATGVTDLDADAPKVQKIIYNDKLYIIRGGKVFSAEGQLVK